MASLYLLRRQPLREHEWLLDIFSQQHGRLSVVAGRSNQIPDLLQRCDGDWVSAEDWPRIRGLRPEQASTLKGPALYCALYVTELLARLLPRGEALPDVFLAYQETLQALTVSQLPDPWLRLFEVRLLTALGYGFSWQQDAQGQPLQASRRYAFVPREGFSISEQGVQGADLIAFARTERDNPRAWISAKQVLRAAIDDLLERPLTSRELFMPIPSGRVKEPK
jgi:DNA repair protein RecO (recombination protein O)